MPTSRLRQQHGAPERADGVRPHGNLGPVDLALTALPAQLSSRLDAEVRAMASADVAGATVGVQRQRSAQARGAGGDERPRLPGLAEPEGLEPLERDDAEAGVELGGV